MQFKQLAHKISMTEERIFPFAGSYEEST